MKHSLIFFLFIFSLSADISAAEKRKISPKSDSCAKQFQCKDIKLPRDRFDCQRDFLACKNTKFIEKVARWKKGGGLKAITKKKMLKKMKARMSLVKGQVEFLNMMVDNMESQIKSIEELPVKK